MPQRPGLIAIAALLASALACADGASPVGPLAARLGEPALGYDQYGYNEGAGSFNGPADGADRVLDGLYLGNPYFARDHLVIKWNPDWARGNAEGWANPPYAAWTINQWNGRVRGGSGEVWHYKFVWVGPCGADRTPLPFGGYCIWGQFAVVMSHGKLNSHFWDAHAKPGGFGRYP